jgi:hypothetical protein
MPLRLMLSYFSFYFCKLTLLQTHLANMRMRTQQAGKHLALTRTTSQGFSERVGNLREERCVACSSNATTESPSPASHILVPSQSIHSIHPSTYRYHPTLTHTPLRNQITNRTTILNGFLFRFRLTDFVDVERCAVLSEVLSRDG